MAAPITPTAPAEPAPEPIARPKLVQHPGRVATVIIALALVVTLGVVLLQSADTDTAAERRYPSTVDSVNPGPGELIRLQDTIAADLREGLTGVLVIDGGEVPEDQLERVAPLGQVSFRPGPDQDLERFEAGEHTVTVLYWPEGKDRPARPGAYSWRFRAGA